MIMKVKLNKKTILGSVGLLLVIFLIWNFFFNKTEAEYVVIKPKVGYFRVAVINTGELKARNSIEIMGPSSAQKLSIYQMKVSKIVPEGTTVKKGDFVAELDKSEIMSKIQEMEIKVQKNESQFLQAKLDSNLNLSAARNELENLKYSLEEKKLQKEQSIYEAPAIQRQAEIAYEREQRTYDQAIKNYGTKIQQAIAKLQEVGADVSIEKQKMGLIMKTFEEFTITAPADGMVIYARDWGGQRVVEGSAINSWYPLVASLPDLSIMESLTYVNEIDIQKIKVGQAVKVGLDANPNKKLTGRVMRVANIGEERANSNSKVFEVTIQVDQKDSVLLPSMTTSNEIFIEEFKKALYVPLEAVHTENINGKKTTFVYRKDGSKIFKQEIVAGAMNENSIIIKKGITDKDDILLSLPLEPEKISVVYLQNKK